jgi:hypothetical protein
MFFVQCKGCLKSNVISDGDVHVAVDAAGCTCCPDDHHHGQAAGNAATGGVPCRPLTIVPLGDVSDEQIAELIRSLA